MILLRAQQISHHFGKKEILKNISFEIKLRERIFLLGKNGAGKSTLFKIIADELSPQDGHFLYDDQKPSIARLPQINDLPPDKTLAEYLEEAFDTWKKTREELKELESDLSDETKIDLYEKKLAHYQKLGGDRCLDQIGVQLEKVGIPTTWQSRTIASLSGGQKQKVFLSRLVLTQADLLLLDEPTNHLDLQAIEWLEHYILGLSSAVVVISHDLSFIRKLANKVFQLTLGKLDVHQGGYDEFMRTMQLENERRVKLRQSQEEEQAKLKTTVEKFRSGTRASQAKNIEKRLTRIELVDVPLQEKFMRKIEFPIDETLPKDVLKAKNLSFAYHNEAPLFQDISFNLHRGDRVALIGLNGAGKSTLIKLMQGELAPQTGTIKLGARIQPAYFDQELRPFRKDVTIFDAFSLKYTHLKQDQVRGYLGGFLFSGDDVFKTASDCSGGELARLQLLDMLLQKPNFLLLDEPTNNLDMTSISVLRHAIQSFEGSFLLISHDRALIDATCNKIFILSNGNLHTITGTYNENKEKIHQFFDQGLSIRIKKERIPQEKINTSARVNQFKLDKAEQKVSSLENEIEELNESLGNPELGKDYEKLLELQTEKEKKEKELEAALLEWEEVSRGK